MIQVWLGVSNHATQGMEQAEHIFRSVLGPLFRSDFHAHREYRWTQRSFCSVCCHPPFAVGGVLSADSRHLRARTSSHCMLVEGICGNSLTEQSAPRTASDPQAVEFSVSLKSAKRPDRPVAELHGDRIAKNNVALNAAVISDT